MAGFRYHTHGRLTPGYPGWHYNHLNISRREASWVSMSGGWGSRSLRQYREMTNSSRMCPFKNRAVICVQPHKRRDRSFGEASTSTPRPSSVVPRQKDRSNASSEEQQYCDRATWAPSRDGVRKCQIDEYGPFVEWESDKVLPLSCDHVDVFVSFVVIWGDTGESPLGHATVGRRSSLASGLLFNKGKCKDQLCIIQQSKRWCEYRARHQTDTGSHSAADNRTLSCPMPQ